MIPRRAGFPLGCAAAVLLLSSRTAGAEECSKRICRDDYHFDGTYCRSRSGLNWKSHYKPESPVCPMGWEVSGDHCEKSVCCEKPVCKSDERYKDGYCWSGPSGIGGYKSHTQASCEPGWEFDPVKGICKNPVCRPVAGGLIVMQPWAPLQITGYEGPGCVRRGGPLAILGNGFGDVQGPNSVEIGGHGVGLVVAVVSWSGRRIVVTIPNDPRLETGQWYYAGILNDRRQWISNIDRNFTICR